MANLEDFARVLVLDKWTCNSDGRQAIFARVGNRYKATFIDHGYCFNAGEWSFPDAPLRGVYANSSVYEDVKNWDSFEPVLSRAEQIDGADIWRLTEGMPEEWWSRHDSEDLSRLVENLCQRRSSIRDLISAFRNSTRNPFPNWAGN